MRFVYSAIFCVLSAQASALSLYCDGTKDLNECGVMSEKALENLGCSVNTSLTDCKYGLREDPKNPGATIPSDQPYCELTSANCSSPLPGNFGGENCFDRQKVSIARRDRVHNGYWFGLFGSYSRTVCLAR